MALGHFGGHFFKHLSYIPITYFSIRYFRNLTPPAYLLSRVLSLSSAATTVRAQWRRCLITGTLSASSSAESTTVGSFQSPYVSASIYCHKDVVDMLSEALLCFGASSTSVEEHDIHESDEKVCISSIFTDCKDVGECISHAANSIGLKEIPHYEVIMGDHSDWIKKTQESFLPVEVAAGLWIVPEWRTPPDLQATNIILNPGLAFGTGEHPTTKLCLLLLHGLIRGGELFLDYGTGSGILAIAALKFGAALSVGFDVDPQAITSARQNAELNNIIPEKMQLHLLPSKGDPPFTEEVLCGDVKGQNSYGTGVISEAEVYDVVIANILLNPLLDLADHIVSYAKPGAVVGVSGILSDQIPYAIECYSQFLEGISVSKMDDWACISGTRKKES